MHWVYHLNVLDDDVAVQFVLKPLCAYGLSALRVDLGLNYETTFFVFREDSAA